MEIWNNRRKEIPVKLIHCADLHLDSRMETHMSTEQATKRRNEILNTFARIADYAKENGVAAVLIAGDLFDRGTGTDKARSIVFDTIASHPEILFYYLSGNHDGAGTENLSDLPQNLFLFGADWKTYRLGNLTVSGSERPDPATLTLRPEDLNIVLLHGQVSDTLTASGENIPLRAYRKKSVDYLALGHLHAYATYPLDERGIACYAGCPEGRGFDECGKKGFVLLETLPDRKIRAEFLPFAARTLHEIPVDLTGISTQNALRERVDSALAGIPSKDMVKVVLQGKLPSGLPLNFSLLDGFYESRFFFVKITDKTRLLIRPEDFDHDISLKGEFVRKTRERQDLSEEEKDRVLACGLQVLCGEEPTLL